MKTKHRNSIKVSATEALAHHTMAQPSDDERSAFEATRRRREALTERDLLPINVDVHAAASIALGAIGRVQTFAAALAMLPGATEAYDDLARCAQAADYANALWLTSSNAPDGLQPLVAEAQQLRARAFAVLELGVAFGITNVSFTESLRGGTAYADLSADLFAAENELRTKWLQYERAFITAADLVAMRQVATKLNEVVSNKQFGSPERTRATLDRQRAFTVLARTYDQVRRGMAWIRWDEGDLDQLMPSLWTRPGGGRRGSTDLPATSTTEPVAAAAKPATSVTSAAPTVADAGQGAGATPVTPTDTGESGPFTS